MIEKSWLYQFLPGDFDKSPKTAWLPSKDYVKRLIGIQEGLFASKNKATYGGVWSMLKKWWQCWRSNKHLVGPPVPRMKGPIYYGGVWGQGGLIGEGGPIPICAAMCCPSRNADKKVEPAAEGSNSHLRGICPTNTDVSRAFLLVWHLIYIFQNVCKKCMGKY